MYGICKGDFISCGHGVGLLNMRPRISSYIEKEIKIPASIDLLSKIGFEWKRGEILKHAR